MPSLPGGLMDGWTVAGITCRLMLLMPRGKKEKVEIVGQSPFELSE